MRGIVTVGRVSLTSAEAEDWAKAVVFDTSADMPSSRRMQIIEPGSSLARDDWNSLPQKRTRLGCG